MSRLDRFRNLERKRPDQPDDDAAPQASGRFGKIEPRRAEPAAAPPDPFGPPPEDNSPLEVQEDDRAEAKRLHAERDAHAKAQFVEEAAALMLERDQRDAIVPRPRLDLRQRAYVAGGGLIAIAILAQVIGPYMWGLAPVLVLVLLAGMLSGPD